MDEPHVWFLAIALIVIAHVLIERNGKACCAGCAGKAKARVALKAAGGCATEAYL